MYRKNSGTKCLSVLPPDKLELAVLNFLREIPHYFYLVTINHCIRVIRNFNSFFPASSVKLSVKLIDNPRNFKLAINIMNNVMSHSIKENIIWKRDGLFLRNVVVFLINYPLILY